MRRSVTTRASHLELGEDKGGVFSASLEAKMQAGLGKRMSGEFMSYGAPTAFVFKGVQAADGNSWFNYLIECGPGSTLRLSVAIDREGKVKSFGFNRF
jgi:hypothetical protein